MIKNNKAIIIFCRYPVEGKVKTRLAADYGNKFASAFYRLSAEHTFEQCRKLIPSGINGCIYFSDKNVESDVRKWIGEGFEYHPQKGNNLGEQMSDAFCTMFSKGINYAVIIGTDIPDISDELIRRAYKLLDNNDFVIGPANDGGFYLLGMENFYPGLFDDIKWSTSSVYGELVEKILRQNLKFANMEVLTDIDTKADLKEWLAKDKNENSKNLSEKLNQLILSGNSGKHEAAEQ